MFIIYVTHSHYKSDSFSPYTWCILIVHMTHSHHTRDSFSFSVAQGFNEWNAFFFFFSAFTLPPLYLWVYYVISVRLREYIHASQTGTLSLWSAHARTLSSPPSHTLALTLSHPLSLSLTFLTLTLFVRLARSLVFSLSLSPSLSPSLSLSLALARSLSLLSQTGYTEVLDVSCCASLRRCCSFLGGCIVGSAEPAQYAMTTDFSGSSHKLHHTATHIPQHTASRPQQHSNTI